MDVTYTARDAAGAPVAGAVMLITPTRQPGAQPVRLTAGDDGALSAVLPDSGEQYDVLVSSPAGRVLARWTTPTQTGSEDGLRYEIENDGLRAVIY